MTLFENRSNQRIVATATSSQTSIQKLEDEARTILNKLAEELSYDLPYGVLLEGRVAQDMYANYGMYVFFRKGEQVFPGDREGSNNIRYLPETVGGHWISMNKGDGAINYSWEARDLRKALKSLAISK